VCTLQLRRGHIFNIEAGKQALRNVNSLALFSNIEVNPRPDEKSEGGIIVEVKLKELEQKTAEVNTEWSIVPGSGGRPSLVCLQYCFFILLSIRPHTPIISNESEVPCLLV
jgi:outer membrane protein assembly factor BamA